MKPEQIEDIARRKVLDYMQDIIIDLAVAAGTNPEKRLEDIKAAAFAQCAYDDPTVEPAVYQALQAAIKHHLTTVFESIQEKADRRFDDL